MECPRRQNVYCPHCEARLGHASATVTNGAVIFAGPGNGGRPSGSRRPTRPLLRTQHGPRDPRRCFEKQRSRSVTCSRWGDSNSTSRVSPARGQRPLGPVTCAMNLKWPLLPTVGHRLPIGCGPGTDQFGRRERRRRAALPNRCWWSQGPRWWPLRLLTLLRGPRRC